MHPTPQHPEPPSRWPHRIAILLAAVVFPLIWVGGLVTTYDAGMAVPDWPGTYGYNMFLYPIETWLFGPFDLLVEHGHRLLGSLAGLIAIVLLFVTVKFDPRLAVRGMALGLLALVIFQGLLGGMRVLLDARTLAKLHGCVGPAFFAAVAGFCVVTSKWWWQSKSVSDNNLSSQTNESSISSSTARAASLARFALIMLAISYGQLIVGAFLRHIAVDASPNQYKILIVMHVTTAVLIVIGTVWQWLASRRAQFESTGLRGSINVLMILIGLQFLLGIGTWVVKFGWPIWFQNLPFAATFVIGEKSFLQMNLITAHVAVGSLILALWMIHLVRCFHIAGGLFQSAPGRSGTATTVVAGSAASAVS